MLRQTFVYHDNILQMNDLRVYSLRQYGPESPSESLVESGLRHSGGKTFRAEKDDSFAPSRITFVTSRQRARVLGESTGTRRRRDSGSVHPDRRRAAHV